jgi:hypothetical protein
MTTQPEALRLADALDLYAKGDAHQRDIEQAADELRKLHEVNQELLAALKALSDADKTDWFITGGLDYIAIKLWIQARAAIAKAEGEIK